MEHPTEETFGLYLGDALNENQRTMLLAHVETCGICARTLHDLIDLDGVLSSLPPALPPPRLARRVRARLLVSPTGTGWRRVAAAACILLAAGAIGGAAVMRSFGQPAPIVRDADGPKFALMFAEDAESLTTGSASERGEQYAEFMRWMRGLGDGRVRLGGSQLDDSRGRIIGTSAQVTAPDLVLSGFLVIRASGYDEAERLARDCPIVARGGQVIVRQLR
jgi:hypothetical protein